MAIVAWCCALHPATTKASADLRHAKRCQEVGRRSDAMLKDMAHGSNWLYTPWRHVADSELNRRADLA